MCGIALPAFHRFLALLFVSVSFLQISKQEVLDKDLDGACSVALGVLQRVTCAHYIDLWLK